MSIKRNVTFVSIGGKKYKLTVHEEAVGAIRGFKTACYVCATLSLTYKEPAASQQWVNEVQIPETGGRWSLHTSHI